MTEQRVSAKELTDVCREASNRAHRGDASLWVGDRAYLDLRDARAEIAALRAQLATVREEGFVAGRDAADVIVTAKADLAYNERETILRETDPMGWQYFSGAATLLNNTKYAIRALQPPQDKP